MRSLLLAVTTVVLGTTLSACRDALPDEGPMPTLSDTQTWFNSRPLTNADLQGHVVLIDFWTYSCVNCLRVLPYVKAWNERYRDYGLIVIGIHAPEFDFEEDTLNVKAAMTRLAITYPVVLDNDMALWKAFDNKFWPAHYFIDVDGNIRYHHFGEGGYDRSEQVIRRLLKDVPSTNRIASEAGLPKAVGSLAMSGHAIAAEKTKDRSPETYVGYLRAARVTGTPALVRNAPQTYHAPPVLQKDDWSFDGSWIVAREYGESHTASAAIIYQYYSRDINLVLGTALADTPVKFRVTLDGKAPGDHAGDDINADGFGVITEHRMYQLIRRTDGTQTGTFKIEFETPGARVYAFTFG